MSSSTRPLTYDVVMATRNRPEAVELSLPMLLAQTRPPEQILIVDSSDDGAPIEILANAATASGSVPVHYIRSEAGLTHQRNRGLARCTANVVLFPDDDSLLWADCAEALMEVYEADTEGVVAGVAGRPMDHAPPQTPGDLGSYEAEPTSPMKARLRGMRQGLKEALGAANPFISVGMRLNGRWPSPGWLKEMEAVVVPYMTGFRMSFRREVIAATGFDETLAKYGWFEDIDASFAAMRRGKVLTANRARIYHHRTAAARANGHRMGLWAILNRSYVVMKHVRANPDLFPAPSREAARLKFYCRARGLAYGVMARNAFEQDRARGARDGLSHMNSLTITPANKLKEAYRRLTND